MSAAYSNAALINTAILFSLFLVNHANAGEHHSLRRHPAQPEQPALAPVPIPPPPPPTLAQMPALPPQVSFSNGLLTIVAENSTLGDILRAVRTQTGAALEMPVEATERVVTHLGPGPAREVLATLMNGSQFNYVLLGSAAQPGQVDRLILTPISGRTQETVSAAVKAGESGMTASLEGRARRPEPPDDGAETAANAVSDEDAQGEQPNGQPQGKSPEELLRDLQQQQSASHEEGRESAPPQ
jgi:hypothetical protein